MKTGADAKKVADAYAGRLVEFDFGTPLPMGIVPRDAPGHTPGHTVYELPDLLVVGDLLHAAAVQLPRPDISIAFDADAKMVAETRRSFLAEAAAGTRLIAAVHLPFPGIGRIATSGEGFRLYPLEQDATMP